jgi:hypothetical protein
MILRELKHIKANPCENCAMAADERGPGDQVGRTESWRGAVKVLSAVIIFGHALRPIDTWRRPPGED